jgi:hypothetical protein
MRANQEQYDYEVHQKSRRRSRFQRFASRCLQERLPQGDARVASASLLEFISMKQSGAHGFFLSRLKVGTVLGEM